MKDLTLSAFALQLLDETQSELNKLKREVQRMSGEAESNLHNMRTQQRNLRYSKECKTQIKRLK